MREWKHVLFALLLMSLVLVGCTKEEENPNAVFAEETEQTTDPATVEYLEDVEAYMDSILPALGALEDYHVALLNNPDLHLTNQLDLYPVRDAAYDLRSRTGSFEMISGVPGTHTEYHRAYRAFNEEVRIYADMMVEVALGADELVRVAEKQREEIVKAANQAKREGE